MPRADYYIIAETDHDSREILACRLCEKALNQGLKVQIYLQDEVDLAQIDQRLWSFRPDAFIPHGQASHQPKCPVNLTTADNQIPGSTLLINLANDPPECAAHFDRVVEIVTQDPAVLKSTRQSFKDRRDLGWELHRHDQR